MKNGLNKIKLWPSDTCVHEHTMHEHQHSYMHMATQAHTYTTNTHACRHKLECGRQRWGGARKASCGSRNNILLHGAKLRRMIIIGIAIWTSLAIWLSPLKRIDTVKPEADFLAVVNRVWSCYLGKKQKICNLYTVRHSREILSTLYILGGLWRVARYWAIKAVMWLVMNVGCHQV